MEGEEVASAREDMGKDLERMAHYHGGEEGAPLRRAATSSPPRTLAPRPRIQRLQEP